MLKLFGAVALAIALFFLVPGVEGSGGIDHAWATGSGSGGDGGDGGEGDGGEAGGRVGAPGGGEGGGVDCHGYCDIPRGQPGSDGRPKGNLIDLLQALGVF